jgi:hypothetical protein
MFAMDTINEIFVNMKISHAVRYGCSNNGFGSWKEGFLQNEYTGVMQKLIFQP